MSYFSQFLLDDSNNYIYQGYEQFQQPSGGGGGQGGDASTWSQYPATQTVNVSHQTIADVTGITFNNGFFGYNLELGAQGMKYRSLNYKALPMTIDDNKGAVLTSCEGAQPTLAYSTDTNTLTLSGPDGEGGMKLLSSVAINPQVPTTFNKFPIQHLFPASNIEVLPSQIGSILSITAQNEILVVLPSDGIPDGSFVIVARPPSNSGFAFSLVARFGVNVPTSFQSGDVTLCVYSAGAQDNGTWSFTPLISKSGDASNWWRYPPTDTVDLGYQGLHNCKQFILANSPGDTGFSLIYDGQIVYQAGNLMPIIRTSLQSDTGGNELGTVLTTCASSKPTLSVDADGNIVLSGKNHDGDVIPLSSVALPINTWSKYAATQPINANNNNITNVSDITFSSSTILPTIRNDTGSLNLTAALLLTLTSATGIAITSPGQINIGSGNVVGSTTSIEKLDIKDNVVGAVSGASDLVINDVGSINNAGAPVLINPNGTTVIGGTAPYSIEPAKNTLWGSTDIRSTGTDKITVSSSGALRLSSINNEVIVTANSGISMVPGAAGLQVQLSSASGASSMSVSDADSSYTPDYASAVLDVSSNTRGMYLPRLTTEQRLAIPNPQNGLLCYDTTVGCVCMYGPRGWAKFTLTGVETNLTETDTTSITSLQNRVQQLERALLRMDTFIKLVDEVLYIEGWGGYTSITDLIASPG